MSLVGMRKHFRLLLTVYDDQGKPMLFRYYDPRVLSSFLKTCNQDELEIIFGKVKYYFAEMTEEVQLWRFNLANQKLKQTKLKLEIEK